MNALVLSPTRGRKEEYPWPKLSASSPRLSRSAVKKRRRNIKLLPSMLAQHLEAVTPPVLVAGALDVVTDASDLIISRL